MNRILVILALIVVHSGCGSNYGGRQEVKGTIKLKGELLNEGIIDFYPLDASATTKQGALISNGSYNIPRPSGLMPGKYRVSITAGDGKTRASAPDEPPGPTGGNIISKDRIPAEYNVNSKQEVEVTTKGKNVFNYDIP